LYFLFSTNLAQSYFGRVPISQNVSATGTIQIIANITFGDDFALTADGTAYIAGDNTLSMVEPAGSIAVLAAGANNLAFEGATPAEFGRTVMDRGELYIGTNGGLLVPTEGQVHGGQLLAINTNLFGT
jgi:hypothetical protein